MSEQWARLEERIVAIHDLLKETRKDVAEIRKSDARIVRLETSMRVAMWGLGTFGVSIIGVIVERVFH